MLQFETMTMQEMVEHYNKLTGKSIKKFETLSTGKRMLAAAIEENRAKSIQRSWRDTKVSEARRSRTNVEVRDGNSHGKVIGRYRSVRGAFLALGLPIGRHVRFRGIFRANKNKAVFEHDNGKRFYFAAVDEYKQPKKAA